MGFPKITLYVDVVSPFGYIGYHILRNDPAFSKCEITYVPILLGGVMKACGNTAPLNIKNKDKWINKQRLRSARVFNVPMKEKTPPGFPGSTLVAMRALSALTVLHPGREGQDILARSVDALFDAFWVQHKKIGEKDVVAEVLTKTIGEQETRKVMEMVGKEGKEVLSKNSDKAFADGAFGLPYFVATNEKGNTETFWGADHLGQLVEFLGIEKPKTGGWKSMM